MVYFTTTLTTAVSSNPGASTVCNLNWIGGKPTTVVVYSTNTGSSIAFNIQYTMDDPQRVGGSSNALWQNLSSAYSDTGITQGTGATFSSSNIVNDGLLVSFLSPLAAIRLNSTSMSGGPLQLKVIQGEGWALLMGVMGGNLLYHILSGATQWMNLVA